MLWIRKNWTQSQQLTYDMATKGASAVSAENLTPIIDWYKTKEG